MIFASTPPINDDPAPYYVAEDESRHSILTIRERARSDNDILYQLANLKPRPEFDRPRAHEANPILLRFRAEEDGSRNAALGYLDLLNMGVGMLRYRWKADGFGADFGNQHVDHARRVLTRLAALTEGMKL